MLEMESNARMQWQAHEWIIWERAQIGNDSCMSILDMNQIDLKRDVEGG